MNLKSLIKTAFYKAGYSVKKVHKVPQASPGRKTSRDENSDLMGLLHETNPYEGFDFRAVSVDEHGWGGQSPAFRELITQRRPRFIVEVGTWKGASAVEMGGVIRDLKLSCRIMCIDTWLGALEFWTNHSDPDRYKSLQLRNGYPTVYYQFLANVCHRGLQDMIIPFPQTASTAALWLRSYGIKADMVYLDASHEEEDVYQDLCNYWEVVADTGVIFGDDYTWDGVRLAVNRFADENGRLVAFVADKWILHKEGD